MSALSGAITSAETPRCGALGKRVGRCAVTAIALAIFVLSVAAGLAAAAPVLDVRSAANSSAAPGATLTYQVIVQNLGDTPTDGPYTLAVSLPDGLAANSVSFAGVISWDCSSLVVGAATFACTATDPIPESGFFSSTVLTVVVDVAADASGTLTAAFEVSGGGSVGSESTVDPTVIESSAPVFDVVAFDGGGIREMGDPSTQAGGRPFALETTIEFSTFTDPIQGTPWPVEPFKDVVVDLPPGLIGNPSVLGECTADQLAMPFGLSDCPPASQVGSVELLQNGRDLLLNAIDTTDPIAVYNMEPPANAPARFGMNVSGTVIVLDAHLRSGSDYGLSVTAVNAPEIFAFRGMHVTFWGTPSAAAHDFERGCPGQFPPTSGGPTCEAGVDVKPFLRNPTSCTPPGVGLETRVHASSWFHPDEFKSASFVTHEPPGYPYPPEDWGEPVGTTGCGLVPFDPELAGTPATPARANEPSGFSFELTVPQNDDEIGQSDLKRAVVTLPEGVRISPPSALGLAGCSSAQIALTSDAPPRCPDASKIGTVTLETPLLEETLTGNVFLATPFDNPSGSLVALYIVVQGPGVIVKLDGRVDLDPETGQITTIFDDNPQLPFSRLHLQLDDGPHAPVVLPAKCGTYTTHAVLTGWSGKVVQHDSSFTIERGPDGGPCPAKPEFTPRFEAGTISPVAGSFSSFVLNLDRDDADEELASLSVRMPQGLLAKVKGVPRCPAANAALGSCPERSRVGTVTTGAGAGSSPFFLDGNAFWGGPYKNAPFSLIITTPAIAGPFDLGTVVVRSAVHIDRRTARARVVSDPLPTVLQGIPLQIRDVRVLIDRKRFFKNATSCEEKRIRGTIGSTAGSTAHVASRFQLVDCASLRLRPRLTLKVGAKGRTRAGASTPLAATLRQGRDQSGLKSVAVQLPLILNGKLDVIGDACTPAQFNRDPVKEGANARAGLAVAKTPLLAKPLKGSAYFVERPSSSGLPNLIVALRGEVDIDLVGTIRIPQPKNTLGTVFKAIPDVPVSTFTLKLFAGKNGSVGTTANLCSKHARRASAKVRFVGHNGDRIQQRQRLKIAGCPKQRRR
jgi:uncharacterized repeat protein (TIGR01451 family)